MLKINKIPTLLGIVILLVGTFAGVFFLNMQQVFKIGADATAAPKDVRISNLNDTSVTVSWSTEKETVGFVSLRPAEVTQTKSFNHSVTLTGLTPKTTYAFKINSDGTNFDNNGVQWQFITSAQPIVNQNPTIISGSVLTPAGQPAKQALVYLTVSGYLMSTLTSQEGNFVFQVENADNLLEISAVGKPAETTSAQIYPKSAHPIPPMIFGQVYDHRNLPANGDGVSPDANLNLPENSQVQSKFNVATTGSTTKTSTSVILESLDEGEVVTSDKPQFFGKGPGGQSITILIESENPVSQEVKIPQNGSWSFATPENLAPGAHKVTISWLDVNGITRKLTRNFVVQASELPAFEATPSQSLATSSASPSPTPKASPTVKPTSQPIPQTGDLTPTLLVFMMGIVVIFFSIKVWKIADN